MNIFSCCHGKGRVPLLLFVSILLHAEDALAYVDPGIGGLIFQIGYIFLTGVILSVTFWLKSIKRLFQKIVRYIKGRND